MGGSRWGVTGPTSGGELPLQAFPPIAPHFQKKKREGNGGANGRVPLSRLCPPPAGTFGPWAFTSASYEQTETRETRQYSRTDRQDIPSILWTWSVFRLDCGWGKWRGNVREPLGGNGPSLAGDLAPQAFPSPFSPIYKAKGGETGGKWAGAAGGDGPPSGGVLAPQMSPHISPHLQRKRMGN